MSLLQAAYRTYENYAASAGKSEMEKEPLTPISHSVQNAGIEIELTNEGIFVRASVVNKDDAKTIIPTTVESANRTGTPIAHPLCDQLCYIALYNENNEDKYASYLEQLTAWAESEHLHPKVAAVLSYVKDGTIVRDLAATEIVKPDDVGNLSDAEGKLLVRWRVYLAPEEADTACWKDATLFKCFTKFYAEQIKSKETDICMISGCEDVVCDMHPKGTVAASFGAKLISTKDSAGFCYHGRFAEARQAYSVSYDSSQKAHNALRWVVANYGVYAGGRTFICWNVGNKSVPSLPFYTANETEVPTFPSYKEQLKSTLGGYKNELNETDNVIISALEAATTGRLSVLYYNEIKALDFIDRLEDWYTTCCWNNDAFGMQSPPLSYIVNCAYGSVIGERFEADEKIFREHMQTMLHCIISKRAIPQSIIKALVTKAGNLQIYSQGAKGTRERILNVTCAIVRKYRNDKGEEWELELNTQCNDRSYLFGRLLAIAERVEKSTYEKNENRETNAIRMQAVFSQRPMYAWRITMEKLIPYFAKLPVGLREYYKNMISEIVCILIESTGSGIDNRLEDAYLLGYYQQRSVMNQKKNNNENTKENSDEYSE